jgi:tRNA(fMet)-specific endonuclease VapC
MYLLDTCALSDYVKVFNLDLNKKLESYPPKSIFISAITIEEIEFGFAKNASAKKKLATRVDSFLNTITHENILPINHSSAKIAGKIRAQLQKEGITIEQYDILIAATAIANDKILITSNTKHFKDIPYLTFENWRLP